MNLLGLLAEATWKQWAIEWVARYSYVGVFSFLVACGLGFPSPEEVALIGGGYAMYQTHPDSWVHVGLMVATAMAGVLVGDVCLWAIGRRVGEQPERLPLIGHHLSPARMEKGRALFRRHGAKAVFFGRFLFGIRAVTFFVSGSMRVPLWTFVLMDGLAALLTVPASVILAWYFGAQLEEGIAWIGTLDRVVLGGIGVLALVGVGVWWWRRRGVVREGASGGSAGLD